MIRACLTILVCLLCLGPAHGRSLIIVGWDGAGWNNVKPMMDAGELPNLATLTSGPMEIVNATITIPSWTTIWTGTTPDQHGAYTNDTWAPVPYKSTVIGKVGEMGYTTGWFVSKAYLSIEGYSPLVCMMKKTDYHKTVPINRNYYMQHLDDYQDILFNALAATLTDVQDDFLAFIHLDPDVFGHLYGENSERYLEEIRKSDATLGRILAIKPPCTDVIVLADHGFNEDKTHHRNAPDVWAASTMPLSYGTHRDIGITILDYFGFDWRTDPKTYRGRSLIEKE